MKQKTMRIFPLFVLALTSLEAESNRLNQSQTTLGDTILVLNDQLDLTLAIDNTLISLPVPLYEGNSSIQAMQYLKGIALSNELSFEIDEKILVIKGNDFARHSIVLQGKLNEKFLEASGSLGWDILQIAGYSVIEFPSVHQELVQTLVSIPRLLYEFEVNISILETNDLEKKGFQLNNLTRLTTENFDILRFKKPYTLLTVPTLSADRKAIDYLQENTISLSLSCMAGETAVQRIDKTNSVITTSRDALGQASTQTVQSFTSGFIFNIEAYPAKEHCILHIDLEISQDLSRDEDQLPVIARKQTINTGYMKVGDVWRCAEFQGNASVQDKQKTLFLPWQSNDNSKELLLVTIKRTA